MADNVTKLAEDRTNGEAKMPTREELSDLARKVNGFQADMDAARGEIGSLIKNAAEHKNVHKKAFKSVTQILNMDETKREEFLTHFDHYRKVMGVDEGRTADMFDGGDEAAA